MAPRRYSAAAKKTQHSSGVKNTTELATKESETKAGAAKATRTPASPISTHSGASPVKRPLSTSKGSSAKRKAKPDHAASSRALKRKARRLEPDSDEDRFVLFSSSDEDLFVLPTHDRKSPSATAGKDSDEGGSDAWVLSPAKAPRTPASPFSTHSETGQDTSDFQTDKGVNAGTKRAATPAEPLGHGGKRKQEEEAKRQVDMENSLLEQLAEMGFPDKQQITSLLRQMRYDMYNALS